MKPKILIVDDEKPLRDMLAKWLKPSYDCQTAPDAAEAMKIVRATPDLALMITDVKMPGTGGVELLREAKALRPTMSVVLLTAYGSVDLAVDAMRDGADDFFQKPVTDFKAFELRVAKAVEKASLQREVTTLRKEVADLKADSAAELENFTGRSPAMEKVYRLIRKVAPTDATVLIEGPSGSGKELTARALHRLSKRADGPFIAIECSAISKDLIESELFGYAPGTFTGQNKDGKPGCFEAADGGTLFLDEIGEIDTSTQVALLRVLESRRVKRLGSSVETPVNFRLITATDKDLNAAVAEGTFREPLYYRLKVIEIETPALKEHKDDIPLLVGRFLKEFSAQYGGVVTGIEPAALRALEAYDWPGNVRQLRNAIERAVVLAGGEKVTLADLPDEVTAASATSEPPTATSEPLVASHEPRTTGHETLADLEKERILAALAAAGNNKSRAAEALGISRRTLHRKLNEWNMK